MEDLFGDHVAVYKGQPTDTYMFSDEDADKITDEVIFEGLLLKQMAYNLERLKKAGKLNNKLSVARQDGWEELIWAFDLWETPACVTFDVACDAVGADSEELRGHLSQQFGDELRYMLETISNRFPQENQRIRIKLKRYVDLRDERKLTCP